MLEQQFLTVCIIHMMDNKPWNAENEPTCTQFIVLLVSQSILDRFGCSSACFEGNYIYYQMTSHNRSRSVMTGHSHSHGILKSAVIWPVAVMADLGKWPDLIWPVNTSQSLVPRYFILVLSDPFYSTFASIVKPTPLNCPTVSRAYLPPLTGSIHSRWFTSQLFPSKRGQQSSL